MSPTSYQTALSRDIILILLDFEWRRKRDSNPRAFYSLSVFKTDPFSQTWVFLQHYNIILFGCIAA